MHQKTTLMVAANAALIGREEVAEMLGHFQETGGEVFINSAIGITPQQIAWMESKGMKVDQEHLLGNVKKDTPEALEKILVDINRNKANIIVVDADPYCYVARKAGMDFVSCSHSTGISEIRKKVNARGHNL